jgi:hypothetical protein
MIKKVLLALGLVFLVIQAFRPKKNNSDHHPYPLTASYEVPADVESILARACNDCHSNSTRYPWYAEVQPVAWWLAQHVNEGKGHLNFSEFSTGRIYRQFHKFEEIVETVRDGSMPLPSYTWLGLHADARLSADDQQTLITWAENQMTLLRNTYPADSLQRQQR